MSKIYTTIDGDTFDSLALSFFGDEKLASHIIQANLDHCSTLIFSAGVQLTIPDEIVGEKPETLPPWRRDE